MSLSTTKERQISNFRQSLSQKDFRRAPTNRDFSSKTLRNPAFQSLRTKNSRSISAVTTTKNIPFRSPANFSSSTPTRPNTARTRTRESRSNAVPTLKNIRLQSSNASPKQSPFSSGLFLTVPQASTATANQRKVSNTSGVSQLLRAEFRLT